MYGWKFLAKKYHLYKLESGEKSFFFGFVQWIVNVIYRLMHCTFIRYHLKHLLFFIAIALNIIKYCGTTYYFDSKYWNEISIVTSPLKHFNMNTSNNCAKPSQYSCFIMKLVLNINRVFCWDRFDFNLSRR